MMKQVCEMVKKEKAEVVFVDAVVMLESIKLRPYIEEIRKNISDALKISAEHVNVKAKTNEGMGFIGRDEGVAVIATATLKRDL